MGKIDITSSKTLSNSSRASQEIVPRKFVFPRLKAGLRFKLVMTVVLISLFSIIAYTVVLYHYQQKQLIETTQMTSAVLSKTIENGLEHAIMNQQWAMADEMIRAFTAHPSIDRLRILNNQGVIALSSLESEVGLRFYRSEPVCQMCHAGGALPSQKTAIFANEQGEQVFLDVNILRNNPECQTCHGPEERILGLLMLETPLTAMQIRLKDNILRTSYFASGTVLLLVGLMIPILNRTVLKPVEELSMGVKKIRAGDMDQPVEVTNNHDELGQLAHSFEDMRLQLKSYYNEMKRSEQEALTLYELGTKISSSLALNEVLEAVANAARELIGTDVGVVGLLEKNGTDIVIEAVVGEKIEGLKGQHLALTGNAAGTILIEGEPVMTEIYDPDQPSLHTQELFKEGHIASFLAVPLQRGDKFLGVVEVMSHEPRRFLSSEAKLLMRLANQVVVSLENAQLHRQFRYLAILEERNRLAREMHDQLAQALGYLNVKVSITGEQLQSGSLALVEEGLQEMKRVTKSIYTDIRETIFNLRTSLSSEMEFLPALNEYLSEYQVYYGMKTKLAVGSRELADISAEAANQVLYIIQEALTNVRKHAGACTVWIHLQQENEQLRISIEDDGHGFNPEGISQQRQSFGLQIMRERAESVGGSLEIYAQPEKGTRIDVRVPSIT